MAPILRAAAVFAALAAVASSYALDGSADAARRSVKRLFAGPDEVLSGLLVLPAPERSPTRSQVAFIRADFLRSDSGDVAVAELGLPPVDGRLRVFLLGAGSLAWQAALRTGDAWTELSGEGFVPDKAWKVRSGAASQSALGLHEPAQFHELELEPGSVGGAIRLVAPRAHEGRSVVAMVDDGLPEAMSVHLASRLVREGTACELVVRGSDGVLDGLPATRPVAVDRASVRWSDGVVEPGVIEAAPGGAVIVRLARPRAGDAVVWIDGAVQGGDGLARSRTVHYPLKVARAAALGGAPRIETSPTRRDWIEVAIPLEGLAEGEVAFAATELWARTDSRRGPDPGARCLGWIGGLSEVEATAGGHGLRLGFDPAALGLAPQESIELRSVRVHERDGFALVDLVPSVRPSVADDADRMIRSAGASVARPALWHGPAGIASVSAPRTLGLVPGVGSHALALTHGYCADANTWPPANFGADAYFYLNPNQNFSHDAFALDLADRCDQFKSYGVVAHSQGGSAALHLYTFYWSGLDWAGPGRLVQSLGTPFEGTALAGNVAALGEIFGVQCGSTFDMTYDGAAAWLSAIPSAARGRVYTHTTTFENAPFFYDYCNLLSDLLLTDPEDGVVEHSSGHIVGANDMGLRAGWCHVSGMRDPDQTLDSGRNGVMNAQGAR